MSKQEINYANKSNGIVTSLYLECEDIEINHGELMAAIHRIEQLVGYAGTFDLRVCSPDKFSE